MLACHARGLVVVAATMMMMIAGLGHASADEGADEGGDECAELRGVVSEITGACFFAPLGRSKRTWTEAQAVCEEHGGDLASLLLREEHHAFMKLCNQRDMWGANGVWIGATDDSTLEEGAKEGHWMWVGGAGDVITLEQWFPGQPNNWRQQHCAGTFVSYDHRWGDGFCTEEYPFVCVKRGDVAEDVCVATDHALRMSKHRVYEQRPQPVIPCGEWSAFYGDKDGTRNRWYYGGDSSYYRYFYGNRDLDGNNYEGYFYYLREYYGDEIPYDCYSSFWEQFQ